MYTYETRVGYSRTDRSGKVPVYEIMNLMQDGSTFQSEDLGAGMKTEKRGWFLLAYEIHLLQPIKLGQRIVVGTAPTDFKGLYGTRQFFIKDLEGNYLAKANTMWTLMDLEARCPVRITEEDIKCFEPEKLFDMGPVQRKVKLSPEKEQKDSFKVLNTYIDSNGHMNNADYMRVAEEVIPEGFQWNRLQINYRKEVMVGETMISFIHKEEDGYGISFENEAGEVLTVIKLSNLE
jgi:acyl-ACP thioesterase